LFAAERSSEGARTLFARLSLWRRGSERKKAMPSMSQENIDNVDGLEHRFIPLLNTG
jgi:hypothetical protein